MNRRQRRAARRAGIPAGIPRDVLHSAGTLSRCPDCLSEAELREVLPRVWQLVVSHDPPCPWLRGREETPR